MDEIIFDVKNVTKIFGETEETKVNALKNVCLLYTSPSPRDS